MKNDLSRTDAPLEFEKREEKVENVKRKIDRVSREFTQYQFDLIGIVTIMTLKTCNKINCKYEM